MIIANTDEFKTWLIATLKTCCQADPFAVGRYVVALLKKNKPESELREFLLDQLDIFLMKETKPFVDLLFETLKSQSYITNSNSVQVQDSSSISSRTGSSENEHRSYSKKDNISEKNAVSYASSISGSHYVDSNERNRSKSLTKKPKPQRDSQSRSIEKSQSDKREDCEISHSQNLQHIHTKVDHGDTDYRLKKKEEIPELTGKRCQDYDERGFCLRGDLCRFDHGKDPILVEDASLLNFGVNSHFFDDSKKREKSLLMPPLPPTSPPLPPPPPPLPPMPPPILDPTLGTYVPEPYNPEAPGYWGPHTPPVCIHPPIPKPPPSNLIPKGVFNIKTKHRTRELIGIPTVSNSTQMNLESVNTEITQNIQIENDKKPEFREKRKAFDFKRLGPPRKMQKGYIKCSNILEVRKIPVHLNNIAMLNSHFSKFGHVASLEIGYDNDPEAALVKFLDPMDATNAYVSTDAILNNRFIKVFYHFQKKEPTFSENLNTHTTTPLSEIDGKNNSHTRNEANNEIDKIMRENKESLSIERENASIYTKRDRGNLSRTVFFPSALKKNVKFPCENKSSTTKRVEKKDALEKKLQLLRKKQEFLEQQIENQKIVLDKLIKCKNPKEMDFLKQTMDSLTTKISTLKDELKKDSEDWKNFFLKAKGITKTEAEKKLLDAEMDLYRAASKESFTLPTKDETAQLLSRVNELQLKAKAFIDGTSTTIGSANKHSKLRKSYLANSSHSVDHRPKKNMDPQLSAAQIVDSATESSEPKNLNPQISVDDEEEDDEEEDSEARSWRR